MIPVREATTYLKDEYDIDVTTTTVINWIKSGRLEGSKGTRWHTSLIAVDSAMATNTIPPKAGRQRKFTKEQREQMCKMRGKHTLKAIAVYFDCDVSYVSLVCRGLR
ncbi:MAG: hypothetical protein ACXAEN_14345 [Candidatus Thorarchaeota archaeon]|jgi:transposase